MSDQTTADCGCGTNEPAPRVTSLSRILDKVFVSDAERDSRMSICKQCPHFGPVLIQCELCGCFLEAKTRLKGFHCALDRIGEQPKW